MSAAGLTPLFAALQDARHEVRAPAVAALLQVRDPEAVPQLLDALAIPDRRVQSLVATVLGEIGDQRAVLPLIKLLQTGDNSDVWSNPRAAAAQALGKLGDQRAVEPLIAVLSEPDRWTRGHAMEALGRLGDRRAVEPIIEATRELKDSSGATILGNLGDVRAVEPLLAELETLRTPGFDPKHPSVPWQASYYYYIIRALGKLGDPRAVSLLEWVREHETAPVLKGKSLADVADKALQRIAGHTGIRAGEGA